MINSFKNEYEFLSNFYLIDVVYDGLSYPSTEHAFQAKKTLDPEMREQIRVARTPGESKRLGRKVLLREDWEDIKFSAMKEILTIKFENPIMKNKLLETGHRELIEGNHWGDSVWGVCKGKGDNHLGKILMEIREEIRNKNEQQQ